MVPILNFTYNAYVAQVCGTPAATIFHDIAYHVSVEKKNRRNFHDGNYWMNNSKRAWAELYPHMTERQVRIALEKLEQTGFIISGNWSDNKFDQTKWYTVTKKGEFFSLYLNPEKMSFDQTFSSNVHRTFSSNDARDIGIPSINTNNTGETRARLNKPLNAKEVVEEAGKRHYAITEIQAREFIDRYESTAEGGTWMIGGAIVTDWRKLLTLRWLENWQRDNRKSQTGDGNSDSEPDGQSMDEFGEGVRLEREALGIK